jgi:hypothetical protein
MDLDIFLVQYPTGGSVLLGHWRQEAAFRMRKNALFIFIGIGLMSSAPAQAAPTTVVARADGYALRATDTPPAGFAKASRLAAVRVRAALRHRRFSLAAYNPSDGLVYGLAGRRLVGLDRHGARRRIVGLRSAPLVRPRAMAFARTSDRTDGRSARHLYIADRGTGETVEIAFDTQRFSASYAAVTTERAPLLRTIATSGWAPPSPDPSGIVYDEPADAFLVADSEVDEMTIYQGTNLWTTPRGALSATGGTNTTRFSKEPTGIALNPADRTLFVSDDDGSRINVVKPGPDGRHGTADDPFTRISTSTLGIADPEDVAFDTANGHLWVCDGTGREMWRIDPVNGVFGDAGDAVTHFDLAIHGMKDCEGLGIDYRRDTLLAVDPYARKVFELTRTGSLSRILDLSTITGTGLALSGIVEAPTSDPADHPGVLSYWLTDRHVDNGADPNENDGRIFELGIPGATAPPDAPPSVSVTQPASGANIAGTVTVAATASDDVGVTSVRFRVGTTDIGTDTNGSDGWSVSWDTNSVANGSHSLTAVATDTAGNTSAAAPVPVTVSNAVSQTISVPIRLGTDDADQPVNGTVRRSSGDLELGSDQGVPTTVGLRFTALPIPRGATIVRASVQFTADELDRAAATDVIRAQAADNPATFTATTNGLSSRPMTSAAVEWPVPTWTVFEQAGPAQLTPNFAPVVQEVVNRPGWASGNALVLLITGTGRRTAESFEGSYPPVLTLEFATS